MIQQNCLNRRRITISLVISLALSVVCFFSLSNISYAVGADEIALQGKIVRNDSGHEGLNVVTGTPACVLAGADTCDFQVAYYSAVTGGTLYLTETFSNTEIGDVGGIFNLKLGSDASPTTTSECSDGTCDSIEEVIKEFDVLYIEIRFAPLGAGSYTETFTRTTLNASAYAIRSEYAEGSILDSFDFYNSANSTGVTTTTGSVYYDTTESALQVYDGSGWVDLGGGDYSDGGEAGGADRTLGNTDAFALSFLTNNTERLKIESGGDIDISQMIKIDGEQTVYNAQAEDGFTGSLIFGNGGTNLSHTGFFEAYYNTFVGIDSGVANTTGYHNTATGAGALYTNTTGDSNTSLGADSLYSNTTGSYNTATGISALRSNTTGDSNIASGALALYTNTTGHSNVAVGYQTLNDNTTGYRNTSVGYYSLPDVTEGFQNTAIGHATGGGITTGDYNTILGASVTGLTADLSNNVIIADGQGNIRIQSSSTGAITFNEAYTFPTADGTNGQILSTDGSGALSWSAAGGGGDYSDGGEAGTADRTLGNTDAFALSFLTNNTARFKIESGGDIDISQTVKIDGEQTVYNAQAEDGFTGSLIYGNGGTNLSHMILTEGYYNTFIGIDSGVANTTGFSNTAVGEDSFYTNTTGYSNAAIGNSTLYFNTVGYGNTATGPSALYSNTSGDYNTASGNRSLHSNSTGDRNTASGYDVLYDVTEGLQNTALGYNAGRGITTGDYNTILGANVTGLTADLSNNVIIADSAGNIRIQSSSTGAITFNGAYTFPTADGTSGQVLQTDGSGTLTWNSSSGASTFLALTDTPAAYTAGSLLFTSGSAVTEDNANLFWDDGENRFGIGTATPSYALDINGKIGIDGEQTIYNAQAEDGFTGSLIYGNGGTNLSHTAGDEGYYNIFIGIGAGSATTTGDRNTATGFGTLRNNTTGSRNTVAGYNALYSNVANNRSIAIGYYAMYYADDRTTGRETYNTAVGYQALMGSTTAANNTGQYNNAIGDRALGSNTSGSFNIANGRQALHLNTTGSYNIAVGVNALYANSIGDYNTASGYHSLQFNSTGSRNTAVGTSSLIDNTTGSNSTAIGFETLYSNVGNSRSTAIGYQSMYYADDRTTGRDTYNTALGYQALRGSITEANNTGQYNTAIGDSVLFSNTSGYSNTAIGSSALYDVTEGLQNTALGYNTGRGITTGDYNTILGANVTGLAADLNNNVIIADSAGNIRIQSSSTGAITFNGAYTFPTADGTNNQVLTTDGSGALTWSSSAGSAEYSDGGEAGGADRTLGNTDAFALSFLTNNVARFKIESGGDIDISQTIKIDGEQTIYNAQAEDSFTGSLIYGDGGTNLSYTAGNDGYYNTFLGIGAGSANTTGHSNTATGYNTLHANTVGDYNIAIGELALNANISGDSNIAIGSEALYVNTTGEGNTAIGTSSLVDNTTGYDNTAIGFDSLSMNTTGYNNTATGYYSLGDVTEGHDNTAIGYDTGGGIDTGDYNTILGANVTGLAADLSNNVIIADSAGNIRIQSASTGAITFNGAYTFPTADGTSGQILSTDGSGALSWSAAGSGGDYSDGGEAGGADRTLGNTDAFALSFLTNNTARFKIESGGDIDISQTVKIDGEQTIYNAQAEDGFTGSLIYGDGGTNLSHAAGDEGYYNTFLGIGSGFTNTTGNRSTAIGSGTLYSNTTGYFNTAFGTNALYSNTTGYQNTASGQSSLFYNVANHRSTAVGYSAIYYADNRTTGRLTYNTAIGHTALRGSTTPANNTGQYNTAIGDSVLFSNTSGESNVAMGYQSLYSNTTGLQNTAIGNETLYSNTTGNYNTAVGRIALYSNTTGEFNTAVGRYSLHDVTEGTHNTSLGYNTGRGITTGDYNTILGAGVTGLATNLNNNVIIADGQGNIRIQVIGTGAITFNGAYTFPTADGTSGQVLQTDGSGALTWNSSSGASTFLALTDTPAAYTAGSLLFTSGSAVTEDNANLFWDDTGNRLGIGDTTPDFKLELAGTSSVTDRKIGINDTQVVYLPDQTAFEGSLIYGNGGTNLSHASANDGYYNTFIGIGAGSANTTGHGNTATGYNTLHANTEGNGNVAIGELALAANIDGDSNIAIGSEALYVNTTGEGNTAVGTSALVDNTTGYDNTAIGFDSLSMNTTGYDNTSIGYYSLGDVTEGYDNTAIGYDTGGGITTGDYNTILGANVTGLSADLSNNVIIADSEGNIRIQSASTGAITFNGAYTFPTADGTSGQILSTDGSGALSWSAAGSGGDYSDGGEAGGADRTLGNTDAFALSFLTNNTARFKIESGGDIDISQTVKIDGEQTIYNAQAEDGFTGSLIYGDGGTNLSHAAGSEGYYNTFLGIGSGDSTTTGYNNTASGYQSLYSTTTGYNNTASGYQTLYSNVGNSRSTAIGYNAMYYADDRTTGRNTYNTALGYEALRGSTTAADNIGQYNTAIGPFSLYSNTTGQQNIAIGYLALSSNTTGQQNVAIGGVSLGDNTTGTNNTATGSGSLSHNTTGYNNTAFGRSALILSTTGDGNTGVGYTALENVTVGFQNTALGYNTGRGITTGDYNTILGANVTGLAADLSNNVIIADSEGNIRIQSASTGAITFNGTYTFPTADGTSNQVLTTNGSGALTWSSSAGSAAYSDGGEAGGADRTLGNTDNYALGFLTNNLERVKIESGGDIDISQTVKIDGEQTIYNAQAEDGFTGSLIYGNGGTNLSHTAGADGWYNTFVGIDSGVTNTTGNRNTASGFSSLYSNTTGYHNTATGLYSLYSNTTGHSNTASGLSSLEDNTTGFSNTASGYHALHSNTTGRNNTAIGYQSLRSNTTGHSNTASGDSSLRSNTTGYYNVASGYQSLMDVTEGFQNTAIGYNTGLGITTGDNNTILGANVTGLSADLSNNIILADGAGTIRIQVASSGTMTLTGSFESATNNTYDIGSTTTRWKDVYAQGEIEIGSNGDSGNIRYNTTDDQLEFSNDGTNWTPLGDTTKTITLSAEYGGSVLASDGSNNTGSMTSDAEGSSANSMNYYQWNSSQASLQDYDIRLRFTLPSDFVSWGTNAFTFHLATEANTNTNNKLDFYVYEESSSVVDGSSTDQYSATAATWRTTAITGASLGDCDAAGETCLVLIRMYSANDNYSRVGDIDINYTRAL